MTKKLEVKKKNQEPSHQKMEKGWKLSNRTKTTNEKDRQGTVAPNTANHVVLALLSDDLKLRGQEKY